MISGQKGMKKLLEFPRRVRSDKEICREEEGEGLYKCAASVKWATQYDA
jgi:hypothetical protein